MPFCLKTARLAPLAFALLSSAALAAPAVTLSASGNHPKATVQVSGTGFGANQAIDLYFDTTDEVLAVTNGSGKFGPDTLSVPASAQPGSHWISAVERNNGVAAQHAFFVRTRWASLGFDQRGERRNPYENTIDAGNVGNLDLAWSAKLGSYIYSSPVVAQISSTYNPYIFVGDYDSKLYAFDSTGKLVWSKATAGNIVTSPVLSGTTVYAGSIGAKLYAFKASNGAAAWPSPASVGGGIDSSPAIANGIVYAAAEDGKLYAFHASDGTAAWASPAVTGAGIYSSSPAVADGIVYVGSSDFSMYAFDAATGAYIWSLATSAEIASSPAVAGGVVYFGSNDGKIYAVNAATGIPKWSVTTGGEVFSSPAVANGVVYVGSSDAKLYALRASNGATLWTGTMVGATSGGAAVADGVVYIPSATDVEAFSAGGCGSATCSPLWTATTGSIAGNPVISDGVLYFGSQDSKLRAYALDGGNNAAYKLRKGTPPPSYASLHPDMRLKPVPH